MLQAMRPLARRKSSGLGLTAKLHARIVEIVGPAAELPENGGALHLGCADALGSTTTGAGAVDCGARRPHNELPAGALLLSGQIF